MNKKKSFSILFLTFLLIFAVSGCTGEKKTTQSKDEDEKTCFLTISCSTVLNNMDRLAEGKEVLIPKDGYFLQKSEVKFKEGESVEDILKRVTREKGIHLETNFIADQVYINGIGNLYGADCGPESGWMYRINDIFQDQGIGSIKAKENDNIEFVYTCDLGRDVGNEWTD